MSIGFSCIITQLWYWNADIEEIIKTNQTTKHHTAPLKNLIFKGNQ